MKFPEEFRQLGDIGEEGAFIFPSNTKKEYLTVIASNGCGWDHVSVSLHKRSPTWDEMCAIKDLFWDDEEVVIQYHPARSRYINNHPFCLHMWKPIGQEIPTPPDILVGIRTQNDR